MRIFPLTGFRIYANLADTEMEPSMYRRIVPASEVKTYRQVQAATVEDGEKFPQIVECPYGRMTVQIHGEKALLIEAAPCNFARSTETN